MPWDSRGEARTTEAPSYVWLRQGFHDLCIHWAGGGARGAAAHEGPQAQPPSPCQETRLHWESVRFTPFVV